MDNGNGSPILRYILDSVAQVLQETTGNDTTRNLYGLDLFAQQQGATTTYLGYDALSVRLHLAADGALFATYRYGPYGEVGDDGPEGYGYTGEQWDHYIKMTYLRARYYQPETGRFISRDVWAGNVNRPLTLQRYLYVLDNAVNFTDPSGMQTPTPPTSTVSPTPIPPLPGMPAPAVKPVGPSETPTPEPYPDPNRGCQGPCPQLSRPPGGRSSTYSLCDEFAADVGWIIDLCGRNHGISMAVLAHVYAGLVSYKEIAGIPVYVPINLQPWQGSPGRVNVERYPKSLARQREMRYGFRRFMTNNTHHYIAALYSTDRLYEGSESCWMGLLVNQGREVLNYLGTLPTAHLPGESLTDFQVNWVAAQHVREIRTTASIRQLPVLIRRDLCEAPLYIGPR